MKLGVHIPLKKLSSEKLIAALETVQTAAVRRNVINAGEQIRNEKGLENAVKEIEHYFSQSSAPFPLNPPVEATALN